jgi:predicted nucleic acid-binding protein
MPIIVVDTDILINFLRGNEAARVFLRSIAGDATPCCSAITVAEIHAGMRSSEKKATQELLDSLVILPVTRSVAEIAGRLKQTTRQIRLELDDCLIAATALAEEATLATGNRRHYPFRSLPLLSP